MPIDLLEKRDGCRARVARGGVINDLDCQTDPLAQFGYPAFVPSAQGRASITTGR